MLCNTAHIVQPSSETLAVKLQVSLEFFRCAWFDFPVGGMGKVESFSLNVLPVAQWLPLFEAFNSVFLPDFF